MIEIALIGLTLAAAYALVAAGLTLVFGILRVVNFAHGEIFMLGAFSVYLAQAHLGLSYLAASAVALVAMALFGLLMYALVIRPVIQRPWQSGLIATLALSVFLANGAVFVFGSVPRRVSTGYDTATVEILGAVLSYQRVLILVVAVAVFLLLFGFVQYTKTGKAMRAAAQNPDACIVFGINLQYVTAVTMVLAAVMAGVAGALVAPVFSVWPHMGMQMTLKAFAIVIMGGFGRIQGAIVAALIVGLVESFTAAYVSLAFKDVFVFAALVVVLLVRPEGLFGQKERVS